MDSNASAVWQSCKSINSRLRKDTIPHHPISPPLWQAAASNANAPQEKACHLIAVLVVRIVVSMVKQVLYLLASESNDRRRRANQITAPTRSHTPAPPRTILPLPGSGTNQGYDNTGKISSPLLYSHNLTSLVGARVNHGPTNLPPEPYRTGQSPYIPKPVHQRVHTTAATRVSSAPANQTHMLIHNPVARNRTTHRQAGECSGTVCG